MTVRRYGSCVRPGAICRNIGKAALAPGIFLTLCKVPALACEVTLQPIHRFNLDAAIIFSDILTIPDAMGLGLTLNEGVGPRFERPLRSANEVEKLPEVEVETQLKLCYGSYSDDSQGARR